MCNFFVLSSDKKIRSFYNYNRVLLGVVSDDPPGPAQASSGINTPDRWILSFSDALGGLLCSEQLMGPVRMQLQDNLAILRLRQAPEATDTPACRPYDSSVIQVKSLVM